MSVDKLYHDQNPSIYDSMYRYSEMLAHAVAEGAQQAADTRADIKRVPELVPEDMAKQSEVKFD